MWCKPGELVYFHTLQWQDDLYCAYNKAMFTFNSKETFIVLKCSLDDIMILNSTGIHWINHTYFQVVTAKGFAYITRV